MIRILHVVFSLAPGGMENGIVNVSNELDSDEFEIHVCCLENAGAFATRFPNPDHIYCLGKKPGFSLTTVARLFRLISKIKPDVIHSHNFGPMIYSVFASGLGMRAPVLHGEHGQFSEEELTQRRLRHRRWLYRFCKEIHTVSHGLREHIVALKLGSTPITALVNGVDLERYNPGREPEIRKQLGIPEESPVIGMVARLRPSKRHCLLVRAFSSLQTETPSAHLVLVGDGPVMDQVKEEIEKGGCKERVHLVGFQRDPAPYYKIIDLLVVPSNQEGLSNAVLEALACGVPVLCHTACGNDEVISHGEDGWIVPLDSVEQIQKQISLALSQRFRFDEMGRSGRAKIERQFPITQMLTAYKAIYRRITGKK